MMTRKGWLIGLVVLLAFAASVAAHFWRVQRPPAPSAAMLPASARMQIRPFRRDGFDLALAANGELEYRIAMQAGATLVYSWSASHGAVSCQFADRKPVRADEAHGAFVAQSSGWYRWRWKSQNSSPITIHLKLNGYYEPAGMPYDR
jgi:hypothetical protein